MGQAVLVPIIASVAAAAVGAGASAMLAPKPPKMPTPPPLPTKNDALSQALNSDSAMRHRQGAAATMLTGPSGAEAPSPGVKALLGQ